MIQDVDAALTPDQSVLNFGPTAIRLQCRRRRRPAIHRHPPWSGVRIVLSDVKVGIRNVSQSSWDTASVRVVNSPDLVSRRRVVATVITPRRNWRVSVRDALRHRVLYSSPRLRVCGPAFTLPDHVPCPLQRERGRSSLQRFLSAQRRSLPRSSATSNLGCFLRASS